jgi:hypothetical protein
MELAEIAAARIIALILLTNSVSRTLPEDPGKFTWRGVARLKTACYLTAAARREAPGARRDFGGGARSVWREPKASFSSL